MNRRCLAEAGARGRKSCTNLLLSVLTFAFASGLLLAQVADVPLDNWTVPPYAQPASGGITTMVDVTQGIGFVGIQPCRIADTRGNGAPIQGEIFPNSGLRTWDVTGMCGLPNGVDALSVNFTVVSPAGTPLGAFLLAWPTGQPPPPTAIMTYGPGATVISNAAIVTLGPGEQLNVNVSHSTHIVMDVNGYFTDTYNNGGQFVATVNAVEAAIRGVNASPFAGAFGVEGHVTTTSPALGSAGVRGISEGTGGPGVGVWGSQNGSGWGVYGETPNGLGVHGEIKSTTPSAGSAGVRGTNNGTGAAGVGVWGVQNGSGWGVYGSTPAGRGVFGESVDLTGAIYGVVGRSRSASNGAAGVWGWDGGGNVQGNHISAGVRGESGSGGIGVFGLTTTGGSGVAGYRVTGGGALSAGSELGFTTTIGLQTFGTTAATGMKSFVEPHPTDASKIIRYVSLEGNEAGTYFRGKGRFQNGIAVIEVPEDFRIVTDPEGLSIQVTPIGDMATVAVQSIGLERIVVRGSRNVEFFYTVNGIRSAYKDVGPIAENEKVFVPRSPEEAMPEYLPQALRVRLISNGTYRPDGTVNLETARRLGWDKVWELRTRPAPQPTEP